jgi:murein tripeptide amidase MpaA
MFSPPISRIELIRKEEEEDIRRKVELEWKEKFENVRCEVEIGKLQIKSLEEVLRERDSILENSKSEVGSLKQNLLEQKAETEDIISILERTRSALEDLRTVTRDEKATFESRKKELVRLRKYEATVEVREVERSWVDVARKAKEEKGAIKEGKMVFDFLRGELERWGEVLIQWKEGEGERRSSSRRVSCASGIGSDEEF